jgi:hypothetical protein
MEMAFTTLEQSDARLVICLHTSVDPPAAEWTNMLQQVGSLLSAAPDARQIRMLVVTGGGGPDAKQRAQLSRVWAARDIKTAVIVPGRGNPLKRGMMTALSWINPAMAFFTPEQFDNALAHLEQNDRSLLWRELAALQQKLDEVATLRSIARASLLPLDASARVGL